MEITTNLTREGNSPLSRDAMSTFHSSTLNPLSKALPPSVGSEPYKPRTLPSGSGNRNRHLNRELPPAGSRLLLPTPAPA